MNCKLKLVASKLKIAKNVLQYQDSAMSTQKLLALDHFPDALKRLRDISFAQAAFHEAVLEKLKQNYRKSSRRRRFVMGEVVARE